ncbi:MAG: hypothetical protein L7F77_09905 [Candidatus Magnetominusculus sp. LBB02]|nr:hypothetical protein [Candidatus Magnetominusculus sp. LBB02]
MIGKRLFIAIVALAFMAPLYLIEASTYTVYITKGGTGGGTVTPSTGTITWSGSTGTTTGAPSSTIAFYVTSSLGSTCAGWTGCDSVSDNCTCTANLTSDNKSLTVNFSGTSTYILTVVKTGFGTGTVVPSSSSLTWDNTSTTGTATYNANQTIALYQSPSSLSKFSYWQGCDSVSDNGTCSIKVTSNATLTAKFSGYYNVSYNFPYLSTSAGTPTYCIVSNFATDNATADSFTVMSSLAQTPSQSPYALPTTFTIKKGRTTMLTFSNQLVSITPDNASITDNSTFVSIAGSTIANSGYGAKLSWTSALASMTSGIDCRTLLLACFQGTTSPKRNLIGYFCSDDSISGPGGMSNLISY